MKDTMTKFLTYNYTDLSALKEYLEDMALQGWELVNIRSFAKFKKCVPHRIRYNVELVPTASMETNILNDKTKEYIDMCEQAGWRFVSNVGNLFVFATEEENIPDVMTDDKEKVELVKKTAKRQFFSLLVMVIAMIFTSVSMIFNYRMEPSDLLIHALMVVVFSCFMAVTYLTLRQSISNSIWIKKAEKALINQQPIEYFGKEIMKRRRWIMRVYFGFLISMLIALCIFNVTHGEYKFPIFAVYLTLIAIGTFFTMTGINKLNLTKGKIFLFAILFGTGIGVVTGGLAILILMLT